MFKWTQLISLNRDNSSSICARVTTALERAMAASPMVKRSLLAPTMEGVFNGGDLIWHLQFENAAAHRACTEQAHWRDTVVRLLADRSIVAHVDSAAYEAGAGGVRAPAIRGGVYRVAFFAVAESTPPDVIARCEADLLTMPDYLPAIRNWALNRVSFATGSRRWTHIWEQEYADLDGLLGSYMTHPVHWGYVDRWFDGECPERIVDTLLCHSFCTFGLYESTLGTDVPGG